MNCETQSCSNNKVFHVKFGKLAVNSFTYVRIQAALPLQLLLHFKPELGHSISFWVESNSFSTQFNLAYRHSFSCHTSLDKGLRIWMLLWWIAKLTDYFVKSNATLHLTNHKRKSNDPFIAFNFAQNRIFWWLNWLLICRNWPIQHILRDNNNDMCPN